MQRIFFSVFHYANLVLDTLAEQAKPHTCMLDCLWYTICRPGYKLQHKMYAYRKAKEMQRKMAKNKTKISITIALNTKPNMPEKVNAF